MKKTFKIVVAILVAGILGYLFYYFISSNRSSDRLKECPDEKIVNEMPGSAPSSYYVMDGVRKEINEYSSEWVKANCNVPVQKVY